jgi:thiol:disulfide interchange protein DsbC
MRVFFKGFLMAIALLPGGQLALAEQGPEAVILKRLKESRPDLQYGSVSPSKLPGLYEVTVFNGPTLYVTETGDYFLAGDLFAVHHGGFINLAEMERQSQRAATLAAIKPEDMIIFAPKKTRAVVYVFTDIDCGYCQKLHREMAEINELGIEVRYLAFPRAGIDSESYRKIVTAWCADDRKETLTRLKNRERVAQKLCADNPVAKQYMMGREMGVDGLPALVTEDGLLTPGYRPASDLAELLGIKS